MILKALFDYYENHKNELPSYCKELVEIDFIICIDENGAFLRFEDMRSEDHKSSSKFLVRRSFTRSSNAVSNFLYDKCSYVLGFDEVTSKKSKAIEQNKLFKSIIKDIYELEKENIRCKALNDFYVKSWDANWKIMNQDPLWSEIENLVIKDKGQVYFSFRYKDDLEIIAENDKLISLCDQVRPSDLKPGRCLISGEEDNIVKVTSDLCISGSKATSKLVSFQKDQGYDSYGKKQGENAPIGEYAEFAFWTSLKSLLGKDSKNKFVIGSETYIFWIHTSSEAKSYLEECLYYLNGTSSSNFEETIGIEKLRSVFESIYTGKKPTVSEDSFCILGLKPNSARIAVSYWAQLSLREFCGNILKHFDDFKIGNNSSDRKEQNFGIRSILYNVLRSKGGRDVKDEMNRLPSNLVDMLIKSIYEGLPYPQTLLMAVIRRIKAEQVVNLGRAAIIKGTLNRMNKSIKINNMLNEELKNIAYQCGRLFAVIEKLQNDANGISTIRERYLGSASTTPALVFPTLLRLSNHHSNKLENKGKFIFYDKLKTEIISRIESESGFPKSLLLKEQGYFFIGYFQQKESFFTPKSEQKNIREIEEN